jgi:GMP synthase-like glutamine amidotransferase
MTSLPQILVIQNDPHNFVRIIGEWLIESGLAIHVIDASAGEPIPRALDRYVGMIVLGGPQDAFDAPDGTPSSPWFPQLKQLIREAVGTRLPYLGICLGGQLLAEAMGGRVTRHPDGPEVGAQQIAKRDAAAHDRLFAEVPVIADVLQWHNAHIVELPPGAVALAGSPHTEVQAIRVGETAWGLQFHYEYDGAVMRNSVERRLEAIEELGLDGEKLYKGVVARIAEVQRIWHPFTHRFAAVAHEYAATSRGLARADSNAPVSPAMGAVKLDRAGSPMRELVGAASS